MIAVLDTALCNAASVLHACDRLQKKAVMTADPDQLTNAQCVILPGVGTAWALADRIQRLELKDCLKNLKRPVLGICLGMQVLFDFSEEGDVPCLGIFPGTVRRIQSQGLPIPHMGWNQVRSVKDSILLKGLPNESYFYFVHSFRVPENDATRAVTDYGETLPAVLEWQNWFGVQFHPERSGVCGERLLANFLNI